MVGLSGLDIRQAPWRAWRKRSVVPRAAPESGESVAREADGVGDEFLSIAPAARSDWRLGLSAMVVSTVVFAAAAPFAQIPLTQVDAFIPAYQSATTINDLITAVLLLGQYSITRSRALLVLAAGYLFTAAMAVLHALTFPGLISKTGLLASGMQTTAWLYVFWHAGFPMAVIAYAILKTRYRPADFQSGPRWPAILTALAIVAIVVCTLALMATVGESLLPAVMQGNKVSGWIPLEAVWLLSFLALGTLWTRRPHRVLDVWLMVVMCASTFEIGLGAVVNAGRFDLGFYAGRIYGLLAASFVLVVLLLETSALYGRAARASKIEQQDRERRLREVQSELVHLARVSEMGQMVSALAHEVNQPISAISSYIRAGERFTENGEPGKGMAVFRKAAEQAGRAAEILRRLRGFLTKEKSEKRLESVPTMIDEVRTLALLAARGQDVSIRLELDPNAAEAMIDKIQIQQVLLNLTRNAVEAMASSPIREIVISTAAFQDRMIELSVADTGPGIAQEVRAKLFQPFLTTKTNGMGVGLSICRTIVEAHGGRIWTTDNPGGGTIFHLTVPREDHDPEGQSSAAN